MMMWYIWCGGVCNNIAQLCMKIRLIVYCENFSLKHQFFFSKKKMVSNPRSLSLSLSLAHSLSFSPSYSTQSSQSRKREKTLITTKHHSRVRTTSFFFQFFRHRISEHRPELTIANYMFFRDEVTVTKLLAKEKMH